MPSKVPLDDPFTLATLPPKGETQEQKHHREQEEDRARKISLDIDEQIKQDRVVFKKRQKAVKVLLLGQSESGKSTTIKNFQIKYAYDAWAKERKLWRTIIHLNLVRSVTDILNVLGREMAISASKAGSARTRGSIGQLRYATGSQEPDDDGTRLPLFTFNEKHKFLQLRLQPLFSIRSDLEMCLGSEASENSEDLEQTIAAPFLDQEAAVIKSRRPREFFVTTQEGWRGALDRIQTSSSATRGAKKDIEDSVEVIAGCGDGIKQLWADEVVQSVLSKHNMQLEHSSGFFLNDVDRIVARDYEPSDDDVVRARLRTMGVQEYPFSFANAGIEKDWILYDVGGARNSRAAWFSYFEDVTSIIFLAPVSCFDQKLAEDHTVNRLEDSFILWKSVCQSKLLIKVQMILFLNKIDLLEAKLKSGVKFGKYVVNYGDYANDVGSVTNYIKRQFKKLSKDCSPEPREFYCFLTSVIDTKEMSKTIGIVYDGIIKDALKKTEFI